MKLRAFLLCLGLFFLAPSLEVFAQNAANRASSPAAEQTPAAENAPAESEAERVIVTGSNIPRAEEVGPNPEDTYRPIDIEKLGARTATDIQQKIPALTGTARNQNNSNGGDTNADGRTEVNLRGLQPKETLVLFDGRRLAPVGFAMGASVDLNLIPFALVDHIDILKDGASAIYGSDAIGGVFNIFPRHTFHGTEIGSSYGNTNLGASNDAAERDAYVLTGMGNGKTEIVFYAENYDRDAVFSRDRDISSSANFRRRYGGFDARSHNFPGQVFSFDPAFGQPVPFILRPGLDAPAPHSAPNAANSPDYVFIGDVPRRDQAFDYARFTAAIPEADRQYLYGSLAHEVFGKSLEVYADFKYARSFFKAVLAPVPFAPDPFTEADGVTPVSAFAGISVPLSNPFNPFTTPDAFLPDGTPVTTGVTYRGLEAGPRTTTTITNDYLYDAGLRGNLSELADYFKNWNFDLGFRYNENDHRQTISGIVSKAGLRAALLDPNPATAFDPFARNGNSLDVFDRFLVSTTENGAATLTDGLALLSGDMLPLPAGPLSFALGTEYREETVNDRPDELNTSFGSIGGADLQATKGRRYVASYFGELRIPITTSAWKIPGLYSLEFEAAERIESYSDIGTSERPKFSVRWQPLDESLTLRASYTEAFHAPNLSDLAASGAESATSTPDGIMDPTGLTPDGKTVRLLFGGQPNLRPEVAYGLNYGFVWTPRFINGLTISADYYHIDLRDRTNFIDPRFIVLQNYASGGKEFPGQVVRDPATGQIILVRDLIQNIARTITEGIDYELVYAFNTSVLNHGNLGTFTFTLNGTYLSRYVATINLGDREREFAGQISDAFGYLPHHRLYGSLFYDLGGLDAGVTLHYIGQGRDPPNETFFTGKEPRKIREWTTLDALISYTFNYSAPADEGGQVAGDAKDSGKGAGANDGRDKNAQAASSLSYGGWKGWLNGTTITAGMNNVLDSDPPFGADTFENGYDESAFSIQGRFYYVALKKRF